MEYDFDALRQHVIEGRTRTVLPVIEKIVSTQDEDHDENLARVMTVLEEGLVTANRLYEADRIVLAELTHSNTLVARAYDLLIPALRDSRRWDSVGRAILCTVRGDISSNGKDIVHGLMTARGIDVCDLGVNVRPEEILDRSISDDIAVIALSGILTNSVSSMRDVVRLFTEAGIRSEVRILIGGGAVTEEAFEQVQADAWGRSAVESADICRDWLSGA